MFTGIIEETGKIVSVVPGTGSVRMTIAAGQVLEGTRTGDSLCTEGVCLTVAGLSAGRFTSDVMPETVRRTTLAGLKAGDRVNLERALTLSGRLGGHLVTGHIDGTGKILRRWTEDNALWFSIAAGTGILRYIVQKGSVAIDGISLTVARVESGDFTVSLIPHTQAETTLTGKQAGTAVNIECDVIAKYLEKLLRGKAGTGEITLETLARNGFL